MIIVELTSFLMATFELRLYLIRPMVASLREPFVASQAPFACAT